jgi:ATP-dependent RNA helicase DDX47/RRP3
VIFGEGSDKKMEVYPMGGEVAKEGLRMLMERVGEAQRATIKELKDAAAKKGAGGAGSRKRKYTEGKIDAMDRDDDSHEAGMPNTRKKYKGRR